jgi:hypothetical protein
MFTVNTNETLLVGQPGRMTRLPACLSPDKSARQGLGRFTLILNNRNENLLTKYFGNKQTHRYLQALSTILHFNALIINKENDEIFIWQESGTQVIDNQYEILHPSTTQLLPLIIHNSYMMKVDFSKKSVGKLINMPVRTGTPALPYHSDGGGQIISNLYFLITDSSRNGTVRNRQKPTLSDRNRQKPTETVTFRQNLYCPASSFTSS